MKISEEEKKQKKEDLEWLKRFVEITVKGSCEESGLKHVSNIWRGLASAKKTREVRERIEKKIIALIEEGRR